jgi:hypothetical protein
VFLPDARTDDERAVVEAFHADAWVLNPALHVGWADAGATLADGVLTYPDGEVHRFTADADGRIAAVTWEGANGDALTVRFTAYRRVGPLWVATERLAGGRRIDVRDLVWTSGGTDIAATRTGEPFLSVFPDHCHLKESRVSRRILPRDSHGPAWADPEGASDASLWVRPVDGLPVEGRYSTASLQLGSATWLRDSGVLGCDFHVLDVAQLRAGITAATDAERPALLAVLLAWHLDETRRTMLSSFVVERIRRAARRCAADAACDDLYDVLGRARREEGG